MLHNEHNLLLYEKDLLIKYLIEQFLNETMYAETSNNTFQDLLDTYFKNIDRKIVLNYFDKLTCSYIDDETWLNATTNVISTKDYPNYRNVGYVWYSMIVNNFVLENDQILINDFIFKYCEENEIRESIINDLLYKAKLTSVVGTLLGEGLRKEKELRLEEAKVFEYKFDTYSKEIYQLMLPPLTDQVYKIVVNDNEGKVILSGTKNNEMNYIPPTVAKDQVYTIEIQILNSDMHIVERKYAQATVHPQKYTAPIFKTYKVEKTHAIKVRLPEVEGDYSYEVKVGGNMGQADLNTNPGFLTYTAPNVLQEQNDTVSLKLIWNSTIDVYETVILFDIKMNGTDVDVDDIL